MELVLKLNDHLKETDKELDILIQSRESELEATSRTAIPIVSTIVPSKMEKSLAPTAPPPITLPITTESTTTVGTLTHKTKKLVKSMEEMSMQVIELKKLK